MAFSDPTPRHLASLHPYVAARAYQLINAMREVGIPAWISSSVRTQREQDALVASGASRTRNSYHVAGRAFDIDILGYGRDDLPKWWWDQVGAYGERLGFRWGGRFTGFYDAGHFEL